MKKILILLSAIIFILIINLFVITRPNNSNKFNKNITLVDKNLDIHIDASGKTKDEIQREIEDILNEKNFELIQKDKVTDTIFFKDVNIESNLTDDIERVKKINDSILGFNKFKTQSIDMNIVLTLKEENLMKISDTLNCLSNFKDAKSAYIIEENYEMKIVEAEGGTVTSKEKLVPFVVEEFNKGKLSINLDEGNIYEKPKKTTENKELIQRVEIFNNTINTEFTYTFGNEKITIPKETIYSWVSLSDTSKILFDESAMKNYIKDIAKKYNTIKLNRNFKTNSKKNIQIPYGTYGWVLDEDKELASLKLDLTKGGIISREPKWKQQGWGNYNKVDDNDIGNSYIEINISEQKLWLYLDGDLILNSDIVSGTKNAGHLNPSGVYKVYDMKRDSILTGPGEDKEGEVQYAIFFDNKKAMHDTTLRTEYGGDIYIKDGTSGCINVPLNIVKSIYEIIDKNFPIVIYGEKELN